MSSKDEDVKVVVAKTVKVEASFGSVIVPSSSSCPLAPLALNCTCTPSVVNSAISGEISI